MLNPANQISKHFSYFSNFRATWSPLHEKWNTTPVGWKILMEIWLTECNYDLIVNQEWVSVFSLINSNEETLELTTSRSMIEEIYLMTTKHGGEVFRCRKSLSCPVRSDQFFPGFSKWVSWNSLLIEKEDQLVKFGGQNAQFQGSGKTLVLKEFLRCWTKY